MDAQFTKYVWFSQVFSAAQIHEDSHFMLLQCQAHWECEPGE